MSIMTLYYVFAPKKSDSFSIKSSQAGFTLMEVIISMVLFSFVAAAILYLISFTTKASLLDVSLSNRATHAVVMQSLLSSTISNAGSIYSSAANTDPVMAVSEYAAAAALSPAQTVTSPNPQTITYEYAATGSTPALCTTTLKLYAESTRTLSISTQASPSSAMSDCVTGSAQNQTDYTVPVGAGWSFTLDTNAGKCASGVAVVATESFVAATNLITNATPVEVSTCVQ
ncbi:prepilin-type N-terminal cleavage/methylation domain-containing protein [Acidithiobacillus ferrivorans]|nr:prepilin-type N-terminal cleavage/methylation domain-containing protein [Acidithiobacillus ferrivorans]